MPTFSRVAASRTVSEVADAEGWTKSYSTWAPNDHSQAEYASHGRPHAGLYHLNDPDGSYHDWEHQGHAEFRMPDVPPTLTQATLRLTIFDMAEVSSTYEVFVYNADGAITTGDWNLGAKAGEFSLIAGQGGQQWVSLDPTTLSGVIAEAGDWVGIGIRQVGGDYAAQSSYYNLIGVYGLESHAPPMLDLVWMA